MLFTVSNYAAVTTSDATELKEKIDQNIQDYVENIYLQIEQNTEEEENSLIALLNHNKLSDQLKDRIIDKVNTMVSLIEDIEDPDVQALLLARSKVKAKWENIINRYVSADMKLDEYVVGFLNASHNADQLSKMIVETTELLPDEETVKKMLVSLVKTNDLTNRSYGLILKAFPHSYRTLGTQHINEDKVELLIQQGTLLLTPENYSDLQEHFALLHLKLLERQKTSFFANIAKYELSSTDLEYLLKSETFNIDEKGIMINTIPEEQIIKSRSLLFILERLLIPTGQLAVTPQIIYNTILNSYQPGNKLALLIRYFNLFEKAQVMGILSSMKSPYADIPVYGKRPLLEYSELNDLLVKKLDVADYISKSTPEKKGNRVYTYLQEK